MSTKKRSCTFFYRQCLSRVCDQPEHTQTNLMKLEKDLEALNPEKNLPFSYQRIRFLVMQCGICSSIEAEMLEQNQ